MKLASNAKFEMVKPWGNKKGTMTWTRVDWKIQRCILSSVCPVMLNKRK